MFLKFLGVFICQVRFDLAQVVLSDIGRLFVRGPVFARVPILRILPRLDNRLLHLLNPASQRHPGLAHGNLSVSDVSTEGCLYNLVHLPGPPIKVGNVGTVQFPDVLLYQGARETQLRQGNVERLTVGHAGAGRLGT